MQAGCSFQQSCQRLKIGLHNSFYTINAGESFGSIESVKAVSELFAPMTGEVIEVNPSLKDHPERVNSEPHASWMVKVRLADPGAGASLLDSRQYEELIKTA